jgi:hypothetical protein
MKSISTALAQHLAGEVTTLATCWQITRRDDVVLGFADHVRDLVVDGVTYRAASGYTRTAIRGTADLAVDKPRRRELSATAFETTLAQATGWHDGGERTWTDGANAGQTEAVRSWDAGPARD